VAIDVTAEQIEAAKRLMALSTLEAIKLIHVRAAHMSAADCPVKAMEEKPRPYAKANMIEGTNQFRVVVGHVIIGRHAGTTDLQVDASFELIYSIPADANPTPTELQAFADTNALLNCWPYWRELVHAMAARMELPPLLLPLFRLTPTPAQKQESKSALPDKPEEPTKTKP
jgi:hypothetical protein